MNPAVWFAIIAMLACPFGLVVGLWLGMNLQYRASRGLEPQLINRKEKVEVYSPANAAADAVTAAEQALVVELAAMSESSLKDRAEFFNVRWDERPDERMRVIEEIVQERFHPGMMKA